MLSTLSRLEGNLQATIRHGGECPGFRDYMLKESERVAVFPFIPQTNRRVIGQWFRGWGSGVMVVDGSRSSSTVPLAKQRGRHNQQ